MPIVAAIIPTYNREGCISRAINSVLSQSFPDIEIIVVDDGSTDNTREVVSSFGTAVRYIFQENAGQGPARNRGVNETNAKWIAFLDSDDIWLPSKIEQQIKISNSIGAEISFSDFALRRNINGEGYDSWIRELKTHGYQLQLTGGLQQKALKVVAGPGDAVFTSTVMIRRDVFISTNGYNANFRRCQDVELHLRLALQRRWCFIDNILAIKDWGNNASVELTYLFRCAAFKSAYVFANKIGDTHSAIYLKSSIRNEFRCLSGYWRRKRKLGLACKAGLGFLFPLLFVPDTATIANFSSSGKISAS